MLKANRGLFKKHTPPPCSLLGHLFKEECCNCVVILQTASTSLTPGDAVSVRGAKSHISKYGQRGELDCGLHLHVLLLVWPQLQNSTLQLHRFSLWQGERRRSAGGGTLHSEEVKVNVKVILRPVKMKKVFFHGFLCTFKVRQWGLNIWKCHIMHVKRHFALFTSVLMGRNPQ